MKKSLLLSFLILGFVTLQAQMGTYHPFPTSKSLWSQAHINQYSVVTDKYQYGIFGDTVINSTTYHKLYSRNFPSCGDTSMTASNSSLIGAIMEDNFKRVYYYPFANLPSGSNCGANKNYKLYDFSKQTIGDTILFDTSSTSHCYRYNYLTISAIDSILIDNKYRKQFHFAAQGDTWVEGIGSLNGLLYITFPMLTCSCIDVLTCNLQNDSTYYFSRNYNYCLCYPLEVNEKEEKVIAEISPNPFSAETSITVNGNLNNATLTVYNSIGQQVKQIKNINKQTISIQRDNLPNGLYFVNLYQNNKIVASNKLVITD